MPAANVKLGGRREILMIRQFLAVVEDGDGKIKLLSQRRDRLRDVTRTSDPQFNRRRYGLLVKPFAVVAGRDWRNGEILFYAPADGRGDGGKFTPEFGRGCGVREYQSAHTAPADESIIP